MEVLARIDAALTRITLLDHDRAIAERYAFLRAHLEHRGTRIGEGDLWIGACASVHGLTVVTANEGHSARLPDLRLEAITHGTE